MSSGSLTFHPDDESCASLKVEHRNEGIVAFITLSHLGKMNAMGSRMMMDIQNIFQTLAPMEDLRAVIVKGQDAKAFVGGAFVPEMASLSHDGSTKYITR